MEFRNNVRNWASILEDQTRLQAERLARSKVVHGPVALMPDAHLGVGATVGSVIVTRDAIIPSAVGVDIGCGMIAVETSLGLGDLQGDDNQRDLQPLVNVFGMTIPSGVGKAHEESSKRADDWLNAHQCPHLLDPGLRNTMHVQLGTLGSGNHFLEVCFDERGAVWVVVHSGSRGIGNKLAEGHIRIAKDWCKKAGVTLEDPDLAHLVSGTVEFDAYIADMLWAQDYALQNREMMMDTALQGLFSFVGSGEELRRINCHHNWSELQADGRTWITRKGAIRAKATDYGVIPGSMGAKSYIVRGLGNPLSYWSCSHGAGRLLGRGQAKRTLTTESLIEAMQGKAWNGDAFALLDEHPDAYKDIDQVMEDQRDLVEPIHTLRQVVNYKGL